MTRINTISVEHLERAHLVAEYKELTQFIHLVEKRLDKNDTFSDLPRHYTLDTGHCRFFFNKGTYLANRFTQLKDEMLRRNIKVDIDGYNTRLKRITSVYTRSKRINKDYIPTKQAKLINIDRILLRIKAKPHLYSDGAYERLHTLRGDIYHDRLK